jgi:hypothetical protein
MPHHRLREAKEELGRLAQDRKTVTVLEDLDQHAQPQGAKDVLGTALPLLSHLDDLVTGIRLGEGQVGVFDQGAPQEDDKQDSHHPADEQQERGFPVVEGRPQTLPPDLHHDKGGDGEDRSGHQRLTDTGRGAGDVLLENVAAHKGQAKGGNGDDRCRKGSGDGHARFEPQIGIGKAKDNGHHQTQNDGSPGELRQRGLGRHIGPVILLDRSVHASFLSRVWRPHGRGAPMGAQTVLQRRTARCCLGGS